MSNDDPIQAGERSRSDPTRVILPRVDQSAGVTLVGEFDTDDWILLVPALLCAVGAAISYVVFSSWVGVGVCLLGALLAVTKARLFAERADEWTTPREQVADYLTWLRWSREFPADTSDEVLRRVHGIKRTLADGGVEHQDGRRVALVAIPGVNTDRDEEVDDLAGALGRDIDEELGDIDSWSWVVNGREFDHSEFTDALERVIDDESVDTSRVRREWAADVVRWFDEEQGPRWGGNDWRFAIEVNVDPERDNLATPTTRSRGLLGRLGERVGLLDPLPDAGNSVREEDEPYDDRDYESGRHPGDLLTDRVRDVKSVVSSVSGLEPRRLSAQEHAEWVLSFWAGDEQQMADQLLRSFERQQDGGVTPAERAVTPEWFEQKANHVEVNDRVARTLWIAEWPLQPNPLFMRELTSLTDIDLDARFHARSQAQSTAEGEIEVGAASLGADKLEMAKSGDLDEFAVDDAASAYINAYIELQTPGVRAWRVSGYVTVWADDERQLESDCKTVQRTLQRKPARCTPVSVGKRQVAGLQSCSPTGRDAYALDAREDKDNWALGGGLGALFPACSGTLFEPDGFPLGWNMQNGQPVVMNPLERSTAGHGITAGTSRSGKTTGFMRAGGEWVMRPETERTLIVWDSQGGFDPLVAAAGDRGKHILIDGEGDFSPFEYRATDGDLSGNDLQLKIDDTTSFIAGAIESNDTDPDKALIEEVVRRTYEEHGEDASMDRFLDILMEMAEDADDYTFRGAGIESESKEAGATALLKQLSAFQPGGKYHHMIAEDGGGLSDIDPDETDVIYMDGRLLRGGGVDQSVMMERGLSAVSQFIKDADGEVCFAIDEAHNLFHSESSVEWLQKAVREWARFDAFLWFLTQSLQDFLRRAKDVETGQESHRQSIWEMTATVWMFRCPRTDIGTLMEAGMNRSQAEFIKETATPGRAGKGYAESLVDVTDCRGWLPVSVEISPFEETLFDYQAPSLDERRDRSEFYDYLDREWESVGNIRPDDWDASTPDGAAVADGDGRTEGDHE